MAIDTLLLIALAALSVAATKHGRHRLRLRRKRRAIERAGGRVFSHAELMNLPPMPGAHVRLDGPDFYELPPGHGLAFRHDGNAQ